MNTKFTRRLTSLLLMLCLVASSFTMVLADKAYIVTSYTLGGGKTTISEGEAFDLNLNLQELINPGEQVSIVNTSDSFSFTSGGTTKVLGDLAANTVHTFNMRYSGKGKTFSFNIIKNSTGAVVASDSVYVKEAIETSTAPITPIDTSKLTPKLGLVGEEFLGILSAGKVNELTTVFSNTGSYQAKNIQISLEKGEDALPFSVNGSILKGKVTSIDSGKSGELKLKLAVNAAAVPKTYALQFKLAYENAYGDKFSEAVPVYVEIENNAVEPTVSLVATNLEKGPLDAKTPKLLTLEFRNTGSLKASKISAQLTGFRADGARLYEDTDYRLIGSMATGMSGKVQYKLIAGKNAKGPVDLEVVVKYYDDMGVAYEKKYPIFVELAEDAAAATDTKGIVVSFEKATYPLDAKKAQPMTVTVKNTGTTTKENLKLTVTSDATLKFLTPYVQMIDSLKAGEIKTFTFKAMLSGQVTPNTYPLYATVVHQKGAEGDQRVAVAGVFVQEEGQGGSKPKIIIDSYEYGGDAVLAGSTFDLVVRFTNTSETVGIKNAKVVMTADEGIFIPVDAANSFFVERIGAGETVEEVLTLKVKADAKVQMYGISFKIDYEDQNGKSYDEMKNPYTAEEKISLNVKQEVRLEVSDVVLPPEAYVGTPVAVEVEFFNMGKSPMYNLMVKLEGDFQVQNGNYFVGNFEAGRSEFFSGQIFPEKSGELAGTLRFIFEDETGVKQEKKVPVTVMVMDGAAPNPGGEVPPIDPNIGGEVPPVEGGGFKMPLWGWGAAIGGPLLIGGLIALRIRRKRRLKALAAIADED